MDAYVRNATVRAFRYHTCVLHGYIDGFTRIFTMVVNFDFSFLFCLQNRIDWIVQYIAP